MTTMTMPYQDFVLPWESSREEDARFRKILKRVLLALLLLALVFPWLPLPELDRAEKEKVPPMLARIMLEKKQAPPPPAPEQQPRQKEKAAEKSVSPAQQKKIDKARKKVSKMGVAKFSSELSSLRSSLDVANLKARNTNISTGAAEKSARNVLGRDSATKSSGGVDSSVMNGTGSGTQLAGHTSTQVDSPVGGGGSGAAGGGGSHRSTVAGGRDMESIRRTFEQHKGAIYAIYNRALRSDPGLKGKFVFHIVIQPDGSISSISLKDSQLADNTLETKLLARISLINFGPEDVAATPVNYKFDFLPG